MIRKKFVDPDKEYDSHEFNIKHGDNCVTFCPISWH